MMTLVSSASRNSLDWTCLDNELRRLAAGEIDLDGLLPDRWRAARPDSVRIYRDAEREACRARTQNSAPSAARNPASKLALPNA